MSKRAQIMRDYKSIIQLKPQRARSVMCKLKYKSKLVEVLKNKDIGAHLTTSGCKELCFYSGLPTTPDLK